jgi:hypothetical protein
VQLAPIGFLDALQKQGALRERGGAEFTVAGYGMQLVFPPTQEIPEDGLRRFAQAVYGGITKLWLTLLQNPVAHEGGIWKGDSGGPAFWVDPDSQARVQVAITQWGNPQAWSRFTRIDVPEVLEWIGAVIAAVEAEEEN